MKTLFLDIFSGMSGDMFLGAMLDLGVDLPKLEAELSKLNLSGYHLHARRARKASIEGVKFDVHLEDHHGHALAYSEPRDHHHPHPQSHAQPHHHEPAAEAHHHPDHGHEHTHHHDHSESRDFAAIKELIESSGLSSWVKAKSMAVFARIAAAEGKIHGQPPEQVHFHEVGAIDSIVDIAGACIALEWLGQPRVLASPVVEGTGWIHCAHGKFPVPAPATLEILSARGIPVAQCEEPHELVTPTGAALLAEFVEQFAPMRDFKLDRIGYGLGTRDNKTRPNVLRAILGNSTSPAGRAHDWETDTIAVLETNLDDVSAEILGHFMEQALASGALDVFHTPIQMKKNRPGVLLTLLCPVSESDRFAEMILTCTSALGLRRSVSERRKLQREIVKVKTAFGDIEIKLGTLNGKLLQVSPEFESCRKAAENARVPLKQVYEAAQRAAASSPKET